MAGNTAEMHVAQDGTALGCHRTGSGPHLVLVHGGMSSGQSCFALAQLLANTFTVYLVDRRGRGLSGPQGREYSLDLEAQDLALILQATDSKLVFAHSYGALVTLTLALQVPASLSKMTLYDPPVYGAPQAAKLLPVLQQALVAQDYVRACAEAGIGYEVAREADRSVLEARFTGSSQTPDWPAMVQNVIALERETLEISKFTTSQLSGLSELPTPSLLLTGEHSPDYLKRAAIDIAAKLPRAALHALRGQGHSALRDDPGQLAVALREFFADP